MQAQAHAEGNVTCSPGTGARNSLCPPQQAPHGADGRGQLPRGARRGLDASPGAPGPAEHEQAGSPPQLTGQLLFPAGSEGGRGAFQLLHAAWSSSPARKEGKQPSPSLQPAMLGPGGQGREQMRRAGARGGVSAGGSQPGPHPRPDCLCCCLTSASSAPRGGWKGLPLPAFVLRQPGFAAAGGPPRSWVHDWCWQPQPLLRLAALGSELSQLHEVPAGPPSQGQS